MPAPEHPAYVMYTSGSTGRPKGVVVPHAGLVNVAEAQKRAFGAGPLTRVIQFAALSFDASVFEITMALGTGGTLILADRDSLVPGVGLLGLVRRHAVDNLTIPPSLLARMPAGELPGLATLIVAGDECNRELVARWAPGRRFFNAYGPTETTIWATLAACAVDGRPPSIGRPIANTRAYLLDRGLHPVPAGIPGEMYLGGAGLTRGYLGRPALTAERYLPDSLSGEPGARLYRTGDLARWRPDGEIDFLGRIDHQVKVRGFRIELGEIEVTLASHPAVAEAVVVVREEVPGDRQLAAYVVADPQYRNAGDDQLPAWQAEKVGHWRTLYERTYREPPADPDPTFNVVGWNSSYTGEPLPAAEMREWLDHTVAQILALSPRRVLEIGCGTGLVLFRIAPHCDEYLGTDFSAAALGFVRRHLGRLPGVRVRLEERLADDFEGIPEGSFDAVVLNSVVQYFPGVDYLLRVLEGAVRSLAPGGFLFVGDVRSLPLLATFHTSVTLARAPEELSCRELCARVQQLMSLEEELALDPEFFTALGRRFAGLAAPRIRLKRGRRRNELTNFRYDVILRLGAGPGDEIEPLWLDAPAAGWTIPQLGRRLQADAPPVLGLARVPNARLAEDVRALELLASGAGGETAGELRRACRAARDRGLDPEDLHLLAAERGYEMTAGWSDSGPEGRFDVRFTRGGAAPRHGEAPRPRPWASYANDPLQGRFLRQLVPELRDHLRERLPSYMVPAAFVLLDALPLNPSGKVDRRALPAPERPRSERDAAFVAPRTAVEKALAGIWCEVLRCPSVGVHDNFFELGGDSILSIQIVARARQAGLRLTPRQLFQARTLGELASRVEVAPAPRAEPEPVSGPVPLTPIQHWFFAQQLPRPEHWNQAFLLELDEVVSVPALARAVARLVRHHDVLRHRFARGPDGWQQQGTAPGDAAPFTRIELSALPPRVREEATTAAAARLQASLDLARGPLLRCALFDLGAGEAPRLLLVVHHLVVDAVSWRILLEDLWTVHQQLRRGEAVRLPAKTTSFRRWAERLAEYARSPELSAELEPWRLDPARVLPLPPELSGGAGTVASARTVAVSLGEEDTRVLQQELARRYRMQMHEIVLTALARAWAERTGGPLLVAVEGHGREEIFDGVDLTRTVGWFTTLFPVLLEPPHAAPRAALRQVKEALRRLPGRGLGYGVLRYLSREPTLADAPLPPVSFNHLGRLDRLLPAGAPLAPARQPLGPVQDPGGPRSFALEISSALVAGRLHLSWTYGGERCRRETIEQLASSCLATLRAFAVHARSPEAGGYTPSDFPGARLDQHRLDALTAAVEGGSARRIDDVYELAPVQQGMLFHTLYDPEPGMYFEQLSWTFRGELDLGALRRAWKALIAHHAVLRTSFHWQGLDQPVQVVGTEVPLPWEELDWRELERAEQERRFADRLRAEQERRFDLTRAPAMRLVLVRCAGDACRFIWSQHHILMDGWCFPLLMGELFTCYEAFRRGEDPRAEPPRPYRDYILWLARQDLARAAAAWREHLAGFTAPTPLAVDRPGDGRGVGALGWGEKRLRLPAATTAALRLLAARRLTLNTLFQGAWALLLSRYSGHRDVVFGATVAGRPAELAGSERMVGLFINTLPVRVEVAAEMPRDAWLRRLQEQQLELRRYEFTPLTEIRGGSEVPRDQPLFESLLVFENYPAGTPGSGEATLWLEDFRYSGARTNYPLTVLAAPAEELPLIAAYDRLRFADTTIARMLGHLRCLLEGLAADPGAPLAGLSLLAPGERHQLLCEWSEPGSEEPGDDADLGARIRAQVKLRPDAVAVVFGRERLSYRELDRRAERLARELFDLGAGADASVGVRLERSLELAVAVLAALKAGAPCLCLDPAYPEARLAFMLDDARVQVLVTRPQPGLAPPAGVTVLEIDGELRSPAPPPARPRPRPDDLLFIVYTSGSTGIPKGVGIPHRSLRRLVSWQLRTSAVAAGGVTLQFAALSFDVFFQELYATWCAGGTLAIISDNERRDPEALLRALARHAAQRLFLPFVALRQLAEAAAAEGPRLRLREVITAGEPLRITPSVRRWFARLPGCRLHNQYGPSESHVVTALALSGPADAWPVRPAIGRPVAAGRLHVTGPQLEAVAAGVAGELAIAGDCLARGYLGRPALSAERFVPDAFGRRPGGRLYRTGDLARLLADGTLEFLGRADHQVKVRGFRVEPGEIEAALAEHPAVREAVVDLRRDEAGEGRLVAYLVAHRPGLPAVRELRDFLRRTLPDYMLPALVVELPELPLTPSGKVDRRALPAPDLALAVPEAAAGTALSPVEDLVANVWAQVLGLPRVGVHDHFFELGGHSLLATRVISRLRQIFRVDLPLRSLFEAPTVAGLARRVEEAQRQAREIAVPPLEPLARDLPRNALPLSFAQQRLWFLNRLVPGNPFYNMPGALALSGPLDLGALERSLNELVRRHQTLRTTFPTVRGEAVQAIAPACFRPLPQVDLWRLPAAARQAELRRRTDAEVRRSFDLARGPLVRILLMRLGDDDNALVFTLHHVLADGWSIGVFTRELAALYQAFAAGRPSPLPELPIQYADFAVWQRRWLTGEALDRQLGYWKAQLQGAPQLALPTDRPRPPLGSFRGGIASCTLPLLRELEVLSQRHGCSLFMILLAAFKVLLWRHTSQDDIVVSTLIANRHHLELEGLIGFFANTLVLRTRLDGDPRFEELLARVREITLEAYAHQDLPFEKLVGELEIERDLSRNPLVQVAFILQNAPMGPLELPGLTLRPLDFELGTVRLDLEVHLWAGAEGLQVVFAYDAELFERATMETMLDHYRTLLERAVAAPGDRLSALAAPVPLVKAPAVQAPPPAAAVPAAGVVASSPLEKQVAAIFAEILGRDAVGLYDNFFALGGDSLRATQALIRVEELFEVELSLQALMAAPTVSTLTLAILEQQRGEPEEGEELLAELAELSDEEAERLFRE